MRLTLSSGAPCCESPALNPSFFSASTNCKLTCIKAKNWPGVEASAPLENELIHLRVTDQNSKLLLKCVC